MNMAAASSNVPSQRVHPETRLPVNQEAQITAAAQPGIQMAMYVLRFFTFVASAAAFLFLLISKFCSKLITRKLFYIMLYYIIFYYILCVDRSLLVFLVEKLNSQMQFGERSSKGLCHGFVNKFNTLNLVHL